ncbi:hypothetical protein L7F22_061231 [Adiantum nelumboides]|nr:hypothetical protein [Adiantum nelumboides]
MSLFQLTASAKTCRKHPEERVVGVCSACLAQKLTSLVYTPPSTSDLPQDAASVSVLNNLPQQKSPPGSATFPAPDHDHLQTIKEDEEDSATEVISKEELTYQPSELPNLVEGKSDSPRSGNAQLILDHQESLSSSQNESKDKSEDKSPIVTKEGSLISVSKKLSGPQEGLPTPSLQLYASEPAKCKIRSKSLSVLGADSLKLVQRTSSHVEELTASFHFDNTNASNIRAKKVTLRELFKLDDAEKQKNKCSGSPHTENADCLSDCKLTEEEIPRGAFEDASAKIDEETDVSGTQHNHSHDSRCNCVPSSSSIPSSVCPAKIKQCLLLNPLLCRKKGDEKTVNKDGRSICKPSQFHIGKHRNGNGNEDRNTQAMDDGGLIRATYIASESRVQSMRRCRSKMDLYGARNSFSSSEPSSPGQVFHVDSRSERKFNFSARALAIEVPSMFQAAGGPDAGETNLTAERLVSVNNEVQEGGGLPNNGELNKTALKTLSSVMSQHGNESLACEAECGNGTSDNRPTSQVRGNHVKEEDNKLLILSTPTSVEAVAVDTQMPVILSVVDHAGKAGEIANGNTTEDELIRVCRRVIGSQQRWPSGECRDRMTTSPCDAYAMAMEEGWEGGETAVEHWRRTQQGTTAECGGAAEQNEKAGEEATECLGAWERGGTEDREAAGEKGAIRSHHAECLELGKEGAAGHREGREHREGGAEDREVGEEGEAGEGAGTEDEDGAGHRYGRTEHSEAGGTGGTEHVEAGEERDGSEYHGSCKAGAGAQQQQQLHVVWEPYCKSSGKTVGTTGRTSGRWPPVTARSVGITPDHPLLRFYLTPLRSSSRTRSRPHRSPKRSIWSLVFT